MAWKKEKYNLKQEIQGFNHNSHAGKMQNTCQKLKISLIIKVKFNWQFSFLRAQFH